MSSTRIVPPGSSSIVAGEMKKGPEPTLFEETVVRLPVTGSMRMIAPLKSSPAQISASRMSPSGSNASPFGHSSAGPVPKVFDETVVRAPVAGSTRSTCGMPFSPLPS